MRFSPVTNPDVTVVLTAYNDEASIGFAVEDFRTHPRVRRVIVVDNNSTDRTAAEAEAAGAVVVRELRPATGTVSGGRSRKARATPTRTSRSSARAT